MRVQNGVSGVTRTVDKQARGERRLPAKTRGEVDATLDRIHAAMRAAARPFTTNEVTRLICGGSAVVMPSNRGRIHWYLTKLAATGRIRQVSSGNHRKPATWEAL